MSTKSHRDTDSGTDSVETYLSQQSLFMAIAELFYPAFQRIAGDSDYIDSLESDLNAGNVSYTSEIYGAGVLGVSVLAGILTAVLTWIFSSVIFTFIKFVPDVPVQRVPYEQYAVITYIVRAINATNDFFASLVLALLIGGVIFGVVFGLGLLYPRHLASRRERRINFILPDLVGFMYSMSVGGTNQIRMLETAARAKDAYGEGSIELQRVVHEMKYFNTDYQTAIRNAAEKTPSDDMQEFLTDMLSVIDSGGDITSFLESQQEVMRERSKRKQEDLLDTLEFFGEMYLSLNILPMALLIVFVIISLMGTPQLTGMYATVYAILPGINIIFLLLISTAKRDELGDGTLKTEGDVAAMGEDETDLFDLGVVDHYVHGRYRSFFNNIRIKELQYRVGRLIRSPWKFFYANPSYTLLITLPVSIILHITLIASGVATLSISGLTAAPFAQTVLWVYVPILLNTIPWAVFYELNHRSVGEVTDTLTTNLRKLANANETGQPLLEAIRITGSEDGSLLEQELEEMYKKTMFNTSLSAAIVEFNNRYKIPRLAREMKLIQKAQEASSNITPVLRTAAESSRHTDELEQERVSRTKMQVAILGLTFAVFLGVILVLQVFFIGKMMGAISQQSMPLGSFQSMDMGLITMLFYHSVTVQALSAGTISGYIQTGDMESSLKYIIAYLLVTAIAWGLIA